MFLRHITRLNAKPWVRKWTWDGKKTTREIIVAEEFGPQWFWPNYHYPRAPIVPCADCGGECPEGTPFPCEKLRKWTESKCFSPGGKKYRKRVYCPKCEKPTKDNLITPAPKKQYEKDKVILHEDVWVCRCDEWFSPPAERYGHMLSEFSKTLVTRDVEDYYDALINEGREYGIEQVFEVTLPVPIERVSLGLKEDLPPITISERKPLQSPCWFIYAGVNWVIKMVRDRTRHLVPPPKIYRPKITTQQDENGNPEMPLHFRIRTISWKQGYYSRIFLPDRWR